MITKIEGFIKSAIGILPKIKGTGSLPMWVVILFGFFYLLLFVLFIVAWTDDWLTKGKPELVILDNFIKTAAGATVVIAFIASYLVDKDKDGIPDAVEKEEIK